MSHRFDVLRDELSDNHLLRLAGAVDARDRSMFDEVHQADDEILGDLVDSAQALGSLLC